MTSAAPLAAFALLAAVALAGCGGLRVEVIDAQSGAPIGGARVTMSAQGAVASSSATGSGGVASVTPTAGGVLTVAARGYASWGEPIGDPPPSSLRVALDPTWIDSFLDDKRTIGADAPTGQMVTPKRCPCDPPAR